jgi:hypothetical protein
MKAAAIRTIGKRAVCDLIEIEWLLADAKLLAGRGNWLPWLDREFGWSDETARKWMNVYELSLKFQPVERLKSAPRTTRCPCPSALERVEQALTLHPR